MSRCVFALGYCKPQTCLFIWKVYLFVYLRVKTDIYCHFVQHCCKGLGQRIHLRAKYRQVRVHGERKKKNILKLLINYTHCRYVLETCTYKVTYQSVIYYLASPVWQLIICVRMLHVYSTPLCTWLHAYSKTKPGFWNGLFSLVHSIKTQSQVTETSAHTGRSTVTQTHP